MPLVMSRADLNALPQMCRKAPEPLPFAVMAYAFGQWILPYAVPVTHRKVRSFQVLGGAV